MQSGFVYKWWVGDKPAFGKIVWKIKKQNICENNYAMYMLKQLFILVSVIGVDIYLAAS